MEQGRETMNNPLGTQCCGFVVGTCRDMCPRQEVEFRIKNNLVHRLEAGLGGHQRLIKCFSRSAAGNQRKTRPEDLRPPDICLKTADFIVNNIFVNCATEDLSVYDFVFDRLRAVRQDLAIQFGDFRQSSTCQQIAADTLEICVKFHLLAGYRFVELANFDAHQNFSHLLECLKTLLVLLQLIDPMFESRQSIDMACVYLLLNLGSAEALRWALGLPKEARSQHLLSVCLEMSLSYWSRNFFAVFKRLHQLPVLQLLAFHWNLPKLYSEILSVMSTAYNGGVCQFPMEHFVANYFVNDVTYCRELCRLHGLETSPTGIKFIRSNFQTNIKAQRRRWNFIDQKISTPDDFISFFASIQMN